MKNSFVFDGGHLLCGCQLWMRTFANPNELCNLCVSATQIGWIQPIDIGNSNKRAPTTSHMNIKHWSIT